MSNSNFFAECRDKKPRCFQTKHFIFFPLTELSLEYLLKQPFDQQAHKKLQMQKDDTDSLFHSNQSSNQGSDPCRSDFFCVEKTERFEAGRLAANFNSLPKYLGFVQLESMKLAEFELFIGPEDEVTNLGILLTEFSDLAFFGCLGRKIECLHYKQTTDYFLKYEKLILEAGFEFERIEWEVYTYSQKRKVRKI